MKQNSHRRPMPLRSSTGLVPLVLLAALVVGLATPAAAAPTAPTTPVTIATVPPVPGFPVTLDGVSHLTDATGKVHFDAAAIAKPLTDRVRLNEAVLTVGGQQLKATATRLYRFDSGPQLALNLSYLVGFTFSNHGTPVKASAMKTIVVRGGTGQVVELPAHEPSWLQGRRAVPKRASLVVKNVDWSVERVISAGSNVVNQSQQRFRPGNRKTVDVTVLFFSLRVRVSDGLYGLHLSNRVQLQYPDRTSRTFSVDENGEATLPNLPRGDYVLTPLGAGLTMAHPVGISRDQTVDIQFYSWVDVLTVLGTVLALAAALAWIGRRRRRRAPAPASAGGRSGGGTLPSPRRPGESPDLEDTTDRLAG
jgi:hypothetical protein